MVHNLNTKMTSADSITVRTLKYLRVTSWFVRMYEEIMFMFRLFYRGFTNIAVQQPRFKIWVLRPFQEYFTYIEPIVSQRWVKTRPRGYKTFFVLNSIEHEILNAHKYKKISRNLAFLRFR